MAYRAAHANIPRTYCYDIVRSVRAYLSFAAIGGLDFCANRHPKTDAYARAARCAVHSIIRARPSLELIVAADINPFGCALSRIVVIVAARAQR